MEAVDLLKAGNPRLDVRVLRRRCFHDSFHGQAVENVFEDALQRLRLLRGRNVQAAKDPKILAPVVLETVLILRFLLVFAALLLFEVRASLSPPLGPTQEA